MNNFKILKELIKRFQGVRAVLYFAEIIGMGVADGISVVLVSRIIGIITDTAVSKGNLRDTQLVKYIILTIIFKIIIQTTANRIMEIVPSGQLIDKITTYDEYLESDEMARKRQGFAEAANDDED